MGLEYFNLPTFTLNIYGKCSSKYSVYHKSKANVGKYSTFVEHFWIPYFTLFFS